MKGFIEVTQTDGNKTLISVKEIKAVEQCKNFVAIVLDFTTTKKNILNGYVLVSESYSEVIAKIREAIE